MVDIWKLCALWASFSSALLAEIIMLFIYTQVKMKLMSKQCKAVRYLCQTVTTITSVQNQMPVCVIRPSDILVELISFYTHDIEAYICSLTMIKQNWSFVEKLVIMTFVFSN